MRKIILIFVVFVLSGCQSGNSLTRDNFANDYDVVSVENNGYLVRFNGMGSESQKIKMWHKKAVELCGEGNYEGAPRIYSYNNSAGDPVNPMAFGGGVLGALIAGAVSGDWGHKVAAGKVTCKQEV